DFARHIEPVRERGGITAEGMLSGFAPISVATTDAGAALDGAELTFVVSPAYATESIGQAARSHLRAGMTVVVCPRSCVGSLAFKRAAGLDVMDESVLVGETSTLPYAVRATDDGSVHVYHRFDTGLFAAAAPRSGTSRLLDMLRQIWPDTEEAANVFQTTL